MQYLTRPSQEEEESEAAAEEAIYRASEAGNRQEAVHGGQYDMHKVWTRNGRTGDRTNSFTLDQQGFLLQEHKSRVRDFYFGLNDTNPGKELYESEIETILKEVTGCHRVVTFDHTGRSSSADQREKLQCREPSSVIHNDYTEWSATKSLKDLLGEKAAANIKRFAIINVWRPINPGRVQIWPLCLCDSATVNAKTDIIPVKRISKDRIGEIQMAYHSPNHQWYYYPDMASDEILLIKTYDSIKDGTTNRYTIHSAFEGLQEGGGNVDDKTSIPPRQSIETRAFCIY